MSAPSVELLDLEDLLGHKGFQWLIWRTRTQWGAEAFTDKITSVSKDGTLDPAVRQQQIGQIIVAREAVLAAFGEVDREILRLRTKSRERPDEMADERRGGD